MGKGVVAPVSVGGPEGGGRFSISMPKFGKGKGPEGGGGIGGKPGKVEQQGKNSEVASPPQPESHPKPEGNFAQDTQMAAADEMMQEASHRPQGNQELIEAMSVGEFPPQTNEGELKNSSELKSVSTTEQQNGELLAPDDGQSAPAPSVEEAQTQAGKAHEGNPLDSLSGEHVQQLVQLNQALEHGGVNKEDLLRQVEEQERSLNQSNASQHAEASSSSVEPPSQSTVNDTVNQEKSADQSGSEEQKPYKSNIKPDDQPRFEEIREELFSEDVDPEARLERAEEVLKMVGGLEEGQKLSTTEGLGKAILDAHNLEGNIGQLTPQQIEDRVQALKDVGVDSAEARRALMEAGVLGKPVDLKLQAYNELTDPKMGVVIDVNNGEDIDTLMAKLPPEWQKPETRRYVQGALDVAYGKKAVGELEEKFGVKLDASSDLTSVMGKLSPEWQNAETRRYVSLGIAEAKRNAPPIPTSPSARPATEATTKTPDSGTPPPDRSSTASPDTSASASPDTSASPSSDAGEPVGASSSSPDTTTSSDAEPATVDSIKFPEGRTSQEAARWKELKEFYEDPANAVLFGEQIDALKNLSKENPHLVEAFLTHNEYFGDISYLRTVKEVYDEQHNSAPEGKLVAKAKFRRTKEQLENGIKNRDKDVLKEINDKAFVKWIQGRLDGGEDFTFLTQAKLENGADNPAYKEFAAVLQRRTRSVGEAKKIIEAINGDRDSKWYTPDWNAKTVDVLSSYYRHKNAMMIQEVNQKLDEKAKMQVGGLTEAEKKAKFTLLKILGIIAYASLEAEMEKTLGFKLA